MDKEPSEYLVKKKDLIDPSRPDPDLTCKPGSYFLGRNVLKAFEDESVIEHMWVHVTRVKDSQTLIGLLSNDPKRLRTSLKYGDAVDVKISEIERMV